LIYLILLAVSIALFVGFFSLTMVEARTGTRILSAPRKKLDKGVARVFFIAEHVDWGGFIAHIVQSIVARIAHDVAHVTLLTVRFVERQLTAVVRTLRNRRPNLLAPKPSRSSPLTQVTDYLYSAARQTREIRRKRREEELEEADKV
jgi:hypothetical protein